MNKKMENNIMNVAGVDCYEKDGVAYLRLENVARGLGFTQEKDGTEYVRWDRVKQYLNEIGYSPQVGKDGFIPENAFYRLAMKAKNETAEKFQALVADEIIPSIRKTGAYAISLSPAELLVKQAQVLLEQEKRMSAIENDVLEIKAQIETHPVDWYTVAGYASKLGVKADLETCRKYGKKAKELSVKYGYNIGKTPDPRFGQVNVYHLDILQEAFGEEY